MSNLIAELKRRNVLRVAAAYLVVAWLILQVVDVTFPMLGIDESLGVPVLVLLVLGFPAVLVFAWVFELTPQGLKKEKYVDRSQSVTTQTGRKLDRVIIVVLVAAVGFLLADKFLLRPADEPAISSAQNLNSVAVLPFVNMSGAADNEYFSDGLTETLLHMLAQVPELKVAARTSAFAFKGRDEDIRQIAEALDVATVLEGSVQRAGVRVRITAQLIEADSGFHLWSQTYDRNLDDIFTVQDEIASSVAGALRATLLGEQAPAEVQLTGVGTANTAAYEKFLLGLEQYNLASYGSLQRAEGLFKEALALDPDFVEAKLELAAAYTVQADTGLITPDLADARAKPLLEQVIAANPRHGRALGYLALIDFRESIDKDGFSPALVDAVLAQAEAAAKLAPSEAELYEILGGFNRSRQNFEVALEWFRKGLEYDPLSVDLHVHTASVFLYDLEDPLVAEEWLAKARQLAPDDLLLVGTSADAALRRGEYAEFLRWRLKSMELDPQDHEIPSLLGRFLYQLGLFEEADKMLARARALAPDAPWTRILELELLWAAGNVERAILLAEQMIRDDVENRGGAWNLAMAIYAMAKIELGQAADVLAFLDSVFPGIRSQSPDEGQFRQHFAQYFLVVALAEMGEFEAANAILDPLVAWFEASVAGFDEQDGAAANIAALRGDDDVAVLRALAALDGPIGEHMDWHLNFAQAPSLASIRSDARFAARLAELEAETLVAAEEVRTFLAGRDQPL